MYKNVKILLIAMFFLQFAILGSFIISLGGYLAAEGLGEYIGQFYAISGFVNILFPTLIGIVADRYVPAQRLYGGLHILLAISLSIFAICFNKDIDSSDIPGMISLFSVISCLYYPTISLGFSIAFTSLRSKNIDVKNVLPPIRMFGTIGFIVAMVVTDLLGVQFSSGQFLVGAFFALLLSAWSLLLPKCSTCHSNSSENFNFGFGLLKDIRIAIFFFFILCVGISLKLSEAYVNPFFAAMEIEHPNMLISISRISETICILLVPFFLRTFGIKRTMMAAIFFWSLHFGFMAYGGTTDSILPLIVSMVVYGIGFDFFNLVGMIYLDSMVSPEVRSTAQGLFAMFTNGFGVIIGAGVGQLLFNRYVFSSATHDWTTPWLILSVACIVVLCLFYLMRNYVGKKKEFAP